MCAYVYMQVCTSVYVHDAFMNVGIHVCMYVYVYVYCVCMYCTALSLMEQKF